MPSKILFDTDIGSDLDDAVALAYLLAKRDCNLLGITTVTGDTILRARMCSALCRVAGRAVPIYPGRKEPLLVPQQQPHVPQAKALDRWAHDTDFPAAGEAVEFLRRTIRAHPGEITLLATGPMTNVAALFAADEEIPSLLKALVLMCGSFTHRIEKQPILEWNAKLDPDAAAIVYAARPPVHRSLGLDVTMQVVLSPKDVRARFETIELLRPVVDFAEVWFENQPVLTFHDPIAAAVIFDESICGFERGRVEIERRSTQLNGMTLWNAASAKDSSGPAPHEVAFTIRPEAFYEEYFAAFA